MERKVSQIGGGGGHLADKEQTPAASRVDGEERTFDGGNDDDDPRRWKDE
jgi:hypothetical protein